MTLLKRREFIVLLAGVPLAPILRALVVPAVAIHSVELDEPVVVAESHGDTWAPTVASDGNLYSPSDDTYGFRHATDSNIAFNRLEGADPMRLEGTTVNPMLDYGRSALEGADGCTWKSSGCTFIDGAFYWVVARHKYGETSGDGQFRQTAANASIIRSSDFGRTWVRSARENMERPMFSGRHFATPYFIHYPERRLHDDGADLSVYAISNNGFWDNGDRMILGRVLRSKIAALRGEDWEYYTGGDGLAASAWTTKMEEAKPVLHNPGKLGMTGSVYLPERRRYLLIGWYYPAGGGKAKDACTYTVWDFYEAPKPWGPWRQIGSHQFSPQGYYSPQICPKFLSRERAFIWTAGNWNDPKYYLLTVVPIEFR
jgi:hypothetical protein